MARYQLCIIIIINVGIIKNIKKIIQTKKGIVEEPFHLKGFHLYPILSIHI